MRKAWAVFLACLLLACVPAWAGQGIHWQSLEKAKQQAASSGRMVFAFFYANWCHYCKKMNKRTFKNPQVVDFLNRHFVPAKINVEQKGNRKISRLYKVRGLPTLAFLKADGKAVRLLPGYVGPDVMLNVAKYMHSGAYKDTKFQDFVKSGAAAAYNPDKKVQKGSAAVQKSLP